MGGGTIVLTLLFGLALTTILWVRAGARGGPHVASLGTMSHTWLAAHNASRYESSS